MEMNDLKKINEINSSKEYVKNYDNFLFEQDQKEKEKLLNDFLKYVEDNKFASDIFFAYGMKKFFNKPKEDENGIVYSLKSSNEQSEEYVFKSRKYDNNTVFLDNEIALESALKDIYNKLKIKFAPILITFGAKFDTEVNNEKIIGYEQPSFAALVYNIFATIEEDGDEAVKCSVVFLSIKSDGSYEIVKGDNDIFKFRFVKSGRKFNCLLDSNNSVIFSNIKTIFRENYIYIRYKELQNGSHYVIIGQESVPGARSSAYEKSKTAETKNPWRQYAPVDEYADDNFLTDDGKGLGDLKMKLNGKRYFTNKDIHKNLRELCNKGSLIDGYSDKWEDIIEYDKSKVVNTVEGFILKNVKDIDDVKTYLSYIYTYIKENFSEGAVAEKPIEVFSPREKQEGCEEFIKEKSEKYDKILINAAPRYGKTAITLYSIIKDLDAKKILVLTGQPTNTRAAWKNAIKKFDFGTDFMYYDNTTGFDKNADKFLMFLSFQSGGQETRQKEFDEDDTIDKKALDKLFRNKNFRAIQDGKVEFDVLIIDECHFAANTLISKNIIDKISFKKLIELSGTPYKKLRSGEYTKDQIFTYSIVDDYKRFNALSPEEKKKDDFVQLNLVSYSWPEIGLLNPEDKKYYNDIKNTLNASEFSWDSFFTNYAKDDKLNSLSYFAKNMILPSGNIHMKENKVKNVMVIVDRISHADALEGAFLKNVKVLNLTGGKDKKTSTEVDAIMRTSDEPVILITCNRFTSGVDLPHLDAVVFCCSCNSPERFLQTAMRTCTQYSQEEILKSGRKENGWVYMMNNGQKLTMSQRRSQMFSNIFEGKKTASKKEDFKELANSIPHWFLSYEKNVYKKADGELTAHEFDKFNAIENNELGDFINDDFSSQKYNIKIGDIETSNDKENINIELSKGSDDFKDKSTKNKKNNKEKSVEDDSKETLKSEEKEFLKLKENLSEAFKRIPYLMYEKNTEIKDANDFISIFDDEQTESRYGMNKEIASKIIEYSEDSKKVRLINNLSMFFDTLNSKYRSLKSLKEKDVWENFANMFLIEKLSPMTFMPLKDVIYKDENFSGKDVLLLSTRICDCNKDIEEKAKSVTHAIYEKQTKKINESEDFSEFEDLNEAKKLVTDDIIQIFEWINKKLYNAYELKGELKFVKSLDEIEKL